jgi:hypothetical protein
LPEFLSGLGVEGFELLTHVPVENQSARRRQHGAVSRSPADIKPQDFARCEIDFRKAGEFIRIRTRPGMTFNCPSALAPRK